MNLAGRMVLTAVVLIYCTTVSFTHPQTLQRSEVTAAVFKISDLIKNNYVSEDRAKSIAAHLILEHREGKFDSVKSWAEFASICTRILRDFSNDGHLYVTYDPKTVKNLMLGASRIEEGSTENTFFYSKEAEERNFGFEEVRVLKGNIGYIKVSEINISEKSLATMFAALEFVAKTRALILDLRGNGGGGSEIGPVLESFFLPENITLLEFRNRTGRVTSEKTVSWLMQKRYANPLFIIINKKTASAAEALAFSLQANKRAMIVGQASAGAANMNTWYVVNDQLFVSVSTEAPVLPGTNKSWEGTGVRPDYFAAAGEEVEFIMRKLVSK